MRLTSRRLQRGGGHRDREEGLARARRADPEGDRVVADRVDVALLVDGLRRDLGRAVAPDDVLEDLRRRLVRVERAGDGGRSSPGRSRGPARSARPARATTVAGGVTASSSPSSVITLPRRNTSQSRCPSSALSTASSLPASSAATALSSSSCRAHSSPQRLPDLRRHALAVGAPADLGITAFMTWPMSPAPRRPVSGSPRPPSRRAPRRRAPRAGRRR